MKLHPAVASPDALAPYGELIAAGLGEVRMINEGTCERHHDLARVQLDASGSAGLNVFRAQLRTLPLAIRMLERHPQGSQAFVPLGSGARYIAVLCAGDKPDPANVRAFAFEGAAGINIHSGIWHHPLIALAGSGEFLVVDRIGPGSNLEEIDLAGELTLVDSAADASAEPD